MTHSSGSSLVLDKVLQETFVADGERWHVLDSTNTWAKQLVHRSNLRLPYLIAAENQTAGRGRGDRRWWTGPGSLAFSLILSPDAFTSCGHCNSERSTSEQPRDLHGVQPLGNTLFLSFVAGLAICEAIHPLIPSGIPLGLHWPNDVYVAGRKLAGILIEVAGNRRAIVGIGVNVNNPAVEAPEALRGRVISLRDVCGTSLDRTELLIAILRQIETHLATLAREPSVIVELADRMCLQKGRALVVETDRETVQGICRGIDPRGALILETPGGTRHVMSGTMVDSQE